MQSNEGLAHTPPKRPFATSACESVESPPKEEPKRRRLVRKSPSLAAADCDNERYSLKKRLTAEEEASIGCVAERAAKASLQGVLDPAAESEFAEQFLRYHVPAASQELLLPLLRRWGPARASQVLGLWGQLGDAVHRPSAVPAVQVWGPPGTGKTSIVMDYLQAMSTRHLRLDANRYSSHGELHDALAEKVHQLALSACRKASVPIPASLTQLAGVRLRAQDKLEVALRPSLEMLALVDSQGSGGRLGQVTVVIDSAEKLNRLGTNCLGLMVELPEGLRLGDRFTFVFVGRLPLTRYNMAPNNRQPPEISFTWYTEKEMEPLLLRKLSEANAGADVDVPMLVRMMMKFASPYIRLNFHQLLQVGKELLRSWRVEEGRSVDVDNFHKRVQEALSRRLGLGSLSGILKSSEEEGTELASARFAVQRMTKAEVRLLLAAYLGSRIDKEDDIQLFLPEGIKRRRRRAGSIVKRNKCDDQPVFSRPQKPLLMTRLLAIYHKLARQPRLLGPGLMEHIMNLKEVGYISFEYSPDKEPKVVCKVELPLARACAGELNIDLSEFLVLVF